MGFNLKANGTITVNAADEPDIKQEEEVKSHPGIKTKQDRFYLPVLYINNPQEWPSQPLENRTHFTDKVAYDVCLGSCCGVEGLKAGCCHLDPDDIEHVLGPLEKEDAVWIDTMVKKLRKTGQAVGREDIVIDFEEGKVIGAKFFNSHPVFMAETSYPMIRFQVIGPRFVCKFLNPTNKKCTIYENRPKMCRNYLCQFVKGNFLVRTEAKPNTYQKLR